MLASACLWPGRWRQRTRPILASAQNQILTSMRRFEKKFASPSRARKHVCSHLHVSAEAVAVETKLEAPNAEKTNFTKHATKASACEGVAGSKVRARLFLAAAASFSTLARTLHAFVCPPYVTAFPAGASPAY